MEKQILTALKKVFDLEADINIVDLGLVYKIIVQENYTNLSLWKCFHQLRKKRLEKLEELEKISKGARLKLG